MPRLCFPIALVLVTLALSAAQAQAPSLGRIVSLPSLTGTAPASPVWAPDSSRLAFVWNDEGMPFRDVWVVNADGDELRRLTRLAPRDTPPPEPGQGREAMLERSARRHAGGVARIAWTPDSKRVVYAHGGELWAVPASGGEARPLLPENARGHSPVFSPGGGRIAFVRDHDLWLHDIDRGSSSQVTELGQDGIARVPVGAFAGPDAYVRSHAWSANGRYLAFVFVDRSEVRRVPIPAWLHGEEPLLHEVRRAYPGDRDERQRVGVYDTSDGSLKWLELGDPTSRIFYEIAWSPTASELLVHQGADVAEERWIHVADAASGKVRTVWHDRRPKRVYPIFRAVWASDGDRVRFIGDQHEHYRLYEVDAEGGEPRILTEGDFDVAATRSAALVETRGEALYFVAAAPTPYERQLFRIDGADAEPVRITSRAGVHQPSVSPDGRHVASVHSSDERPSELYVGPAEADSALARVTQSPHPDFQEYDWIKPRYVSFPGPEAGMTLHARIVEPRDIEPGKRYPVLIGNIYSNTVRNAWDAERPTTNLQQRLALTGEYIHVQVDLRGSVGYGVDFREAFQGDWGRGDLRDLVATVDYLKTLDHVDPERIGLWGNSYGGLMVLSALFREPGLFAGGVAGAPAVDVEHFTGYDQHLTRRPDTHPEIFETGSLMDLGEDLSDPLMIIHGMHDDIVPFKTTLMLTEKLMLLGKDFDLVAMPRAPHWWAGTEHYAVYTFGKLEDFFRRHVTPGPRSADGGNGGR
ncbi:prolyl oligopeptidase family serine peptidase [Wenzhouxiangella sp. EGI_FJ10409]|uniref:prolyl oligopeptidase family serine peptidase n=1 Tax=Wenzhouxiangella sp. EGI_FJ10409 TaxID=3243767 RepID=UPI0035DCAE8E